MNHLRRDGYNHCCRKIRKREATRIRNASTAALVGSDTLPSLKGGRSIQLRPSSDVRALSGLCSNPTPIDYPRPRSRTQIRHYSRKLDGEDNDGSLTLQNTAFAAKEVVERRFLHSIETSVWKSSNDIERKKMYRFFFPQMRKVANQLLDLTNDVETLSDSIEKARRSNETKTSEDLLLQQLHSSFLQLTQMVMDILDVAMKAEKDSENALHSLEMLELVLSLSYRTHQLGFNYHRPLYQRLALMVAKHPLTTGQNTQQETATTLGSLARQSRAEWIQAIHRWLRSDWNCVKTDTQDPTIDSLETKHEDIEWFHPSLQALATEGHWTDIYCILAGLLRSDPEPGVDDDSFLSDFDEDFDESVVITSAIRLPYLSEDFVFDLLVPMDRQGRLKNLWNHRSIYSPLDIVLENIIMMIEPSIWKIFHAMPYHHKSTTRHDNINYTVRDAIETLLKHGPSNSEEGHNLVHDSQAYFSDEEEEDSLVKALGELESILDEHLDVSNVGKGERDTVHDPGSESMALATALADQVQHEGTEDNRINSLNAERAVKSFESELPVGQSYSEHVMEKTSLDDGVQERKEKFIDNIVGEDYMDFIYDDRGVDYQDNIPDVMNQLYQSNGNQQLRYSIGLEYQIFEGLRRPEFHFDDEDDFEF